MVIMATFCGETHVAEQIDSILAGQLLPSRILVGDDGSDDRTLDILAERKRRGPIAIDIKINPERLGPAGNFLSRVMDAGYDWDYLAFADQDDIWEPDKLARALAAIGPHGQQRPVLYCSRQTLVDESGVYLGQSPVFSRRLGFANALVQNIATGCTVMINRPALELLRSAGTDNIAFHDWWCYLLVTGAGGEVVFDPVPGIRYRQHGRNVAGSPASRAAAILGRLKRQVGGSRATNLSRNIDALGRVRHLLTPASLQLLDEFVKAKRGSFAARLAYLFRFAPRFQSTADNILFRLLFLLGRT